MTGAEINCQALATKEVKAQESVNAGAWWQGVAEHGEIDPLLPRAHDDQPLLRVERQAHKTTAASFGIFPV